MDQTPEVTVKSQELSTITVTQAVETLNNSISQPSFGPQEALNAAQTAQNVWLRLQQGSDWTLVKNELDRRVKQRSQELSSDQAHKIVHQSYNPARWFPVVEHDGTAIKDDHLIARQIKTNIAGLASMLSQLTTNQLANTN